MAPYKRMLSSDSSPKGPGVGSAGWQTAEVNTAQVIESQAFAFEQVTQRHMSKNRYRTESNSLHHSHSFENQNLAKSDQELTQKLSIQDLEGSKQSDNWPSLEQKPRSNESLPNQHGPSISFRYHPPEIAGEAPLYLASGGNDRYQSNQIGVVPTRPPAEVQLAPAEATYRGRMYSESDRSLWSRPSQWSRNERSALSPQNPDRDDENSTDRKLDSTGNHPACAEQQPSPKGCVEMCDQCNRVRDDVSFCPVCEFHYCSAHWDSQLLHQRQIVKDGVPHERTDPRLAKRVKSIIEPSWTDDQQIQHHRADEDTTWFGVLPDPNGLPNQLLFHDFGRYESFMEQSTFNPKSIQFPSLVSFVGPTGSGKSTIVKALVKLSEAGSSKNENQTPVVGLTQNQAIPTSGEVHLYWNATLHTDRPLMFADCEGLGGGSREPMAARATAISEKKQNSKTKSGKLQHKSGFDSRDASVQHGTVGQSTKFPSHRVSHVKPPLPSYMSMSPSNTPMAAPTSAAWRQSFIPEDDTNPNQHSYGTEEEEASADSGWFSGVNNSYRGRTHPIKWANKQTSRQFIVENLYPRILYTFSDVVVLVMRNAKSVEKPK